MGLGSFLKKASPLSIDKGIAGKVFKPLADKTGDKLMSSVAGTVAKQDTTTGRNQAAEHKVGGTFRDIDRAGGNFTPLQIDNAIARTADGKYHNVGTNLINRTTERGPKDGSDDRYYDSDRNVSIAATAVIGSFAAAGSGGGAAAGSAGDSGTMIGLTNTPSAGGYTSAGNYFGGLSGNASLGAYTETGAYFGGITAGEGAALGAASTAPWYAGVVDTVAGLAPYAKSAYRAYQTYEANQDAARAAESDSLTAGSFDTTYQPLTADTPAAKEQTALLWGAVVVAVVAGLAYANKKGLLKHA